MAPYDGGRNITEDNRLPVSMASVPGFDIPNFDYIDCSYTGDNLTTVVYKTGGASGTAVATLTLAYTGDNLISVTLS